MKKLAKKLGKWAIVLVIADNLCAAALAAWYFSPWWPL